MKKIERKTVFYLVFFIAVAFGLINLTDMAFASQPNYIKETNIRSDRISISWITTAAEVGQINYGTSSSLGTAAYDDRGETTSSKTHHVSISNLSADTTYYYDIVSGGTTYDNGGAHYTITTGPELDPSPNSHLANGQVFLSDSSTPAEGAIVYLQLKDVNGQGSSGISQELSTLVNSSGWWSYNLGNTRKEDLSDYFIYSNTGDELLITARISAQESQVQTIEPGDTWYDPNTGSGQAAPGMTLQINYAPTLNWTQETNYTTGALFPETGESTTSFAFRIKYTDANNHAPDVNTIYIDKNGDGDHSDTGEVNDMTALGSDYDSGVIYTYSTTIPYSANTTNCSYYFRFSDGLDYATGNITQGISAATAINKPDVFQDLEVSITPTSWNLSNIAVGSEQIMDNAAKISVYNAGDGPQTYSLQITNTANWSAASVADGEDVNIFVLNGVFSQSSQATIDSTYFNEGTNDDIILTSSSSNSTATRFGSNRFSKNGVSVASGEYRNLWLQFKAPTKDTTGAQQSIEVTITAAVP